MEDSAPRCHVAQRAISDKSNKYTDRPLWGSALIFFLHFRSEDEQDLRAELVLLKSRMKELEHNIKTCNNIPLKEKFKKDLKDIKQQIKDKEGGV